MVCAERSGGALFDWGTGRGAQAFFAPDERHDTGLSISGCGGGDPYHLEGQIRPQVFQHNAGKVLALQGKWVSSPGSLCLEAKGMVWQPGRVPLTFFQLLAWRSWARGQATERKRAKPTALLY